jgi:thymidylate kinase
MSDYVRSKLIIVEGLTGSGKSIMAHFIARQLQYNGIAASWVHEGEEPHPLLIDVESSIEDYMSEMLANWAATVEQIETSGEVKVVEACFFNNLIDTLLAYNVEPSKILDYGDRLQSIIEPLNPVLVYLVQEDMERALERSFKDRGEEFKDYVIQFTTDTAFAKQRGLEGYEGMARFWREFLVVTDELFQRYHIRKLRVDNSAGNWEDCNRQVMEYLMIPLIPEQRASQDEAMELVGVYKDRDSGRAFSVYYEAGVLSINLLMDVKTRLVRQAEHAFLTEGWHFVIHFEAAESSSGINRLRIGGRNVDYLRLAGTVADKVSA